MRLFFFLDTPRRVLLFAFLALTTHAQVFAQFADEYRERAVAVDAPTNFFFDWQGTRPLFGLQIDLPPDWELQGAAVIRNGFERLPAWIEPSDAPASSYRLRLQRPVTDGASIVLRVRATGEAAVQDIALTPLTRGRNGYSDLVPDEAYRATRRVRLERLPRSNANRALALDGSEGGIHLRASELPVIDTDRPFTVEFWMKTAGLGQVVLSNWDGNEESPYSVEIMVGPNGRLLCYRGRPGEHHVMASASPVADGTWHHVAVVNDPEPGWVRLFIDGVGHDSLFTPRPPRIVAPAVLAVGTRTTPASAYDSLAYAGWIDELRIWEEARTGGLIRRGMRRSLSSEQTDNVFLTFEASPPPELLQRPASVRRERSDLSFAHPIQEFRARVVGDEVSLTWETNDPETSVFIIERSTEGRTFVETGRLGPEQRDKDPTTAGSVRFEFREPRVSDQLIYYRIRQRLLDGSERVTASVKIGVGDPDPDDALLIGNYPNPFNAHTTVTYRLEQPLHVRLSVWDVSGQPVAELVDEVQEAGFYEVSFDAEELPSGTYFVRLQTPSDIGWRTLTLMK